MKQLLIFINLFDFLNFFLKFGSYFLPKNKVQSFDSISLIEKFVHLKIYKIINSTLLTSDDYSNCVNILITRLFIGNIQTIFLIFLFETLTKKFKLCFNNLEYLLWSCCACLLTRGNSNLLLSQYSYFSIIGFYKFLCFFITLYLKLSSNKISESFKYSCI